jgi:hypothetical protein
VMLPETPREEVTAMLAGAIQPLLICGHVHIQYKRRIDRTELVNPGSVGLPLDGDACAAWAILEDGHIGFRRTAYDVAGVIAELEQIGHPTTELIAGRLRRAGHLAEPHTRRRTANTPGSGAATPNGFVSRVAWPVSDLAPAACAPHDVDWFRIPSPPCTAMRIPPRSARDQRRAGGRAGSAARRCLS